MPAGGAGKYFADLPGYPSDPGLPSLPGRPSLPLILKAYKIFWENVYLFPLAPGGPNQNQK